MSGILILRGDDLGRTFMSSQVKVKAKLYNAIYETQNRQNSWKDVKRELPERSGKRVSSASPENESHAAPAGRLQAGPSRILWELPRAQLWCLHHPLVLSAGKRASDSLPVPALEMASIILKEYKIGLYASFSRIYYGHNLIGKTITTCW